MDGEIMADKAPQTDPWVEAAKNYKAAPQSEAAPASGNNDWKLWQENNGDSGNGAAPPATDWLSKLIGQKEEPAIESALQPSMHSKDAGVFDNVMTGMGNIAKGAGHMLTHPEELVTGAIESSPPAVFANDVRDAYKHIKGEPNSNDQFAEHPAESLEYSAGENLPLLLAGGADALPSKARAGRLFADVEAKAGGQPVTLTRSLPLLERAQQLSERGHGTITPLDNLYKRINTINPLDYTEARDRASAISNLASGDKMNATRALQAQAKKLSHAFNEDIGDTATGAGVGPQYTQAMRQFRNASRLGDVAGKALKWGGGAAAAAAGLEGVHRLAKVFTQ